MAVTPIPNGLELTVKATFKGQQIANVLHYDTSGGTAPSGANILNFLEDWWTSNGPEWKAVHHPDYAVYQLHGRDMSSLTGDTADFSVTNGEGTGTGGPLPGNVASVISWRTDTGGRKGRGRTYIGPIPGSFLSAGSANEASVGAVALLGQLAAALLDFVGDEAWQLAVASITDHVVRAITSFIIDSLLDSQRRRLSN